MDIALTLSYLGFDDYVGSTSADTPEEYERLEWPDGVVPPSWDELNAAWPGARKAHYALYRRVHYPPLSDGLDSFVKFADALRNAGISLPEGAAGYVDACLSVKTNFPKPE